MKIFELHLSNIILILGLILKHVNDCKAIRQSNDDVTRFLQKKMIKVKNVLYESEKYEFQDINDEDLNTAWNLFKEVNNKKYSGRNNENRRKNVFLNNIRYIMRHNVEYFKFSISYDLGVNPYADLTDEEFTPFNCNDGNNIPNARTVAVKNFNLWLDFQPMDYLRRPVDLDMRKKGILSSVKNQYKCCSSYAFAAVGAIESATAIKKKHITELSAQEIIDNSGKFYGNHGCTGGSPLQAFGHILEYGVSTEKEKPYKGVQGKHNLRQPPRYTEMKSVITVGNNEQELLLATYHGAVVGFVNNKLMRFYRSGIFSNKKCSKKTNQAILIVGYGNERINLIGESTSYWLIKNSWGPEWGDNGYMKLMRNTHECGIGMVSFLPYVKNALLN